MDTQLIQAQNQTTDLNYAYDPTPGSKFLISPRPKIYDHEIALSVLKTHQRPSRQKRDSEFMNQKFAEEISNDDTLKEIVKQILLTLFDHNQQLGEVKATIKQSRSIDPVSYHLNLPAETPHQHPNDHPDHHQIYHPDYHHIHHDHYHIDFPDHHHIESEHPPTITTHELPAPPGCRSIVTKECIKIPLTVCRTVPDIDCVRVLKSVPALQCTPEAYRECNYFEQKIPYLEEGEECEEIIFDECFEVRQ